MSDIVIVSRHSAAVAFIAEELARQNHRRVGRIEGDCAILEYAPDEGDPRDQFTSYPDGLPPVPADWIVPIIRGDARPEDVRGKHVYGNVPLHLAALAASVTAIEFSGAPPRGQEYGLAEMRAAGARLVRYDVFAAGVGKAALLRDQAREALAIVEDWPEPRDIDESSEFRRAEGRAEGLRQALAIVTGEAV